MRAPGVAFARGTIRGASSVRSPARPDPTGSLRRSRAALSAPIATPSTLPRADRATTPPSRAALLEAGLRARRAPATAIKRSRCSRSWLRARREREGGAQPRALREGAESLRRRASSLGAGARPRARVRLRAVEHEAAVRLAALDARMPTVTLAPRRRGARATRSCCATECACPRRRSRKPLPLDPGAHTIEVDSARSANGDALHRQARAGRSRAPSGSPSARASAGATKRRRASSRRPAVVSVASAPRHHAVPVSAPRAPTSSRKSVGSRALHRRHRGHRRGWAWRPAPRRASRRSSKGRAAHAQCRAERVRAGSLPAGARMPVISAPRPTSAFGVAAVGAVTGGAIGFG